MSISAKDVKKLREMTGAGMMDCKKALAEANGDFDEAVTILRKKGQKISAKRADREATEGVVYTKVSDDAKEGFVMALNCETDFVAKNEDFIKLGQTIFDTVVEAKPENLEALGNLKLDSLTIAEQITEYIGKIGEKIEVTAYEHVVADKVTSYLHSNNKLGVLLGLEGVNESDVEEVSKDIAMQIAAMKPVGVDKDDVPQDIIEKEIEIGKEQARQEGKPENIIEKIALGKLNKFYKENTLLNQQFVKDNSKTISKLLKEINNDLTVKTFKRISIGS